VSSASAAGRRTSLNADPFGGNVFLWQKGDHFGAAIVNQVGACGWNELATREVEKAQQLYGGLFGWEFEQTPNPMTRYFNYLAQQPNERRLCRNVARMGPVPAALAVYFTAADMAAGVEKLQALGGAVHKQPFDIPAVGSVAVVADPHGAAFYLIQMLHEPE